jgi:thioesterase domain-containing protein
MTSMRPTPDDYVEVHVVPGDHVDMMSMPHVHAVADKLAAYLDGSNHKMRPFAGSV